MKTHVLVVYFIFHFVQLYYLSCRNFSPSTQPCYRLLISKKKLIINFDYTTYNIQLEGNQYYMYNALLYKDFVHCAKYEVDREMRL